MKIVVVGTGYVGLSLACLLSENNSVIAVDIDEKKIEMINKRVSPIEDKEIQMFFSEKKLDLVATLDGEKAYKWADIVIIATPTNYDSKKNYFDTTSVERVIEMILKNNSKAIIVIKSTIPVGYVENICKKYDVDNIMFSPEFLREGKALYDNLHPSRIIVGCKTNMLDKAQLFANLLKYASLEKNTPIIYTNPTEAEAIKLFANSYLALRVAFFNELDTYAELNNLNTKDIIDGVCLDPRIGSHYNNPSFGYGGYCLPKDTKQLLANYKNIPENIIKAIVESNVTRKLHIVNQIMKRIKNGNVVGIYRLIMKSGSDNFRESSIFDVINNLSKSDIKIIIYEPNLDTCEFNGFEVVNDLTEFKNKSNLILANRNSEELLDVNSKVYTRDLFRRD